MTTASIRVAIIGVGNCASSFIQGLSYYRNSGGNEPILGLMNNEIGGYAVKDIELCAAFDISAGKVGLDAGEAIFAAPNNTLKFAEVASTGIKVQRGPTLDGLGPSLRDTIAESREPPVDVAAALRRARADVVVNYLPVGSKTATEYYAGQAIEAGCAFVNCIPVFLASDPLWRKKFADRKLPIIGDDIKSQVGATIVHRVLANLFRERGVRIDRTYQLNFGGNSDFLNMLDRERLESKKTSKTQAVSSQFATPLPSTDIHIGPSDFVPWLSDRKMAHVRIEGTGFGGAPINVELKLEVWDSPNAAGVVIDAVRCARLALDRGDCGAIVGPSSYFMKSPPEQYPDPEARELTLRYIRGKVEN